MPPDPHNTQIGIRLSGELVRRIDANRHGKSRAEYCRELIEAGLAATNLGSDRISETLDQAIDSFQDGISEVRQAAVLAEHRSELMLENIKGLREDLATLFVGLLTKLGQVVRDEDQRRFARQKAEQFVARVLFSESSEQGDQP